ncbi:aminotransferase class I/II-fold pyridoxal phosphate-dependent enzyme [Streptomyces sp. PKU-EA00015]|uniref:aminotransferase class I/II-fold pyridoxal phosphate-dependent enzyme n=1 Tax=Streptomyces sp. PKU-EA00015 TaxID=2748326 RepID=UPI0015A1E2F8|nr:aminotransferase class I/II-fold pyridoxal phosphate-dependent enzyme [Streptomyces sp. PKU-EA00015]NWF26687.1 aminotransferase class I/II-fold pyridoxal phosphate-dependent enzyme [Streptomyces sp. PKU-EA00015]
MQGTASEGRGPVRYGPHAPETGLPVPQGPAAVLAGAAGVARSEPPGGGPALREAACGYWERRGLPSGLSEVVAASGAQPLLFALLGAYDGDVLMPRPCPAWWTPQTRLLGRPAYHVPTPAECGGVPDPFALLETVRRVRSEGGRPRLLLLCVPDDPTATVAPPETVLEACEAAVGEGLHIISDETWRDTLHRPRDTVLVSPAEMYPGDVTVISDLAGALTPESWPVAIARFPPGDEGAARRARTLDFLTALGAAVPAPLSAAAAHVLDEPPETAERAVRAAALHAQVAAAVHRAVLVAGAVSRPPQAGRHLYADLGPLRDRLAERGVGDSMELEEYLGDRLHMSVPGGHRFGDELGALRVRLSTGPLLGATADEQLAALDSPTPLELPHVERALNNLGSAFDELR